MSIFTKLKTATDFSASVIKEGFALIWPEKKSDGSVALQVKLEDGSVQEIGGGSAGDIDAAVHIYDATVESSTGVVTITDGTPVSDLAIGDEIRTPDGVYQKTKDSTTTEGPADGTRIKVSGITSPAEANGYYALQSANLWKHETANYWITLFSGLYWMISDKSAPASPGECIFFATMTGPEVVKPWEIDTNWDPMNDSVGDPQVENAGVLTTVSNAIDLFEYASLPVEPENIVQSVNGNKPDASGNVTIETSSGGLTSVSVGNGLTGNGTSSSPITLDLSNYSAVESDISLHTSGPYSVELFKGLNGITIDTTGITLKYDNRSIALNASINYNDNPPNTAGGFAIVGADGKLPSSIIPVSSNLNEEIDAKISTHNSDGSAHPGLVRANDLTNAGIYSTSKQESNLDFNAALTQGFYFANGAECVNGPLSPATSQGWVTVKAIPNGNHALQFYYGSNTDDFFVRRYTGNAWADWVRIPTAESIGTTTNNYNALTEPGDYYLSFGNNTSNVNAPANGPFHVMVHRYQNSTGTARPVLQIAASQIVSEAQTPMMFFRSASYANSAWTFQPWLRLLTEKDVTYNTGTAPGTVTKNDYIKIGNVIVYVGSVNLRLNSGGGFALPVLSNHMTFVASCNTYGVTITKLDIFVNSNNELHVDISGTRSEIATDDQVDVGWIGIGYLN